MSAATKPRRRPSKACTVCSSPGRQQIDYRLASGVSCNSLAKQFDLHPDAIWRHRRHHVSREFMAGVRLGPFKSEYELRKLVAEEGTSVIENVRSIYGGLSARWLDLFERKEDFKLAHVTARMLDCLRLRATLTKELVAAPTTVINNILALPAFTDLQRTLLETLARHPEARAEVIRAFRDLEAKSPPLLEVSGDPEQGRAT